MMTCHYSAANFAVVQPRRSACRCFGYCRLWPCQCLGRGDRELRLFRLFAEGQRHPVSFARLPNDDVDRPLALAYRALAEPLLELCDRALCLAVGVDVLLDDEASDKIGNAVG